MRRSIRARPRSGYSRIYGFGAVLPIALARKFSGSRLAACRGWRAGGEPVIWALMVGKPASIMVLDRVRRVASRWTFWIARGASRCHGRFGSREARMTSWIARGAKANAKDAKMARRGQAVASKGDRVRAASVASTASARHEDAPSHGGVGHRPPSIIWLSRRKSRAPSREKQRESSTL